MKKLIPILFLLISVPVFADTAIPITSTDVDTMVTSMRPTYYTYTARTDECKRDRNLIKAIAIEYYNSNMYKVEAWKIEIEKTRQLTVNEKKDYDYVKSIFELEKKSPKAATWKICDKAMDTFGANIEKQKDEYMTVMTKILEEYKSTNLTLTTGEMKVFTSPTYNTQIAVINAKDLKKYQNELIKFDYVIKLKSVSSMTLIMKNKVVNNKMANFYEYPINAVSISSLQKIYTSYVSAINTKRINRGKLPTHPISTKV